jgi:hypothetical protein
MSTARQKRKPVFDPSALDEDLDEMWPTRTPSDATEPQSALAAPSVATPPIPPIPRVRERTGNSTPRSASESAAVPMPPLCAPAVEPAADTLGDQQRHLTTVTAARESARRRTRPPEVLLSSEVYDELYRVQIAEKKVRRGLARPMGTIVLDAIEAHATRLATTWSGEGSTVGEGQLFERPSSNAVPRRRRHATAPRTVVLSGVTAGNGQRLDNLVQAWGAGTRSALVEQALRYEFGLIPG